MRFRDGRVVVEELAVQETGDERVSADFKHDVAGRDLQGNDFGLIDELDDLGEGLRRNDERQRLTGVVDGLGADGQTEAVDGDQLEGVLRDFELDTGVDHLGIVGRDGEDGLFDHFLQGLGIDENGDLFSDGRKLRIFFGIDADKLILDFAAADGAQLAGVRFNGNGLAGQAAQDVAEQAGIQDDGAVFFDAGFLNGGDAHVHVITGQLDLTGFSLHEDAFDGRHGRLAGNSALNVLAGFVESCGVADDLHSGFSLRNEYGS